MEHNYMISADMQLAHYYRVRNIPIIKFDNWELGRELMKEMDPKILKINLVRYNDMNVQANDQKDETNIALSEFKQAVDKLKTKTNPHLVYGLLTEMIKNIRDQGNAWELKI